ncbi:hypothetical protein CYMTET_54996 [Cymbomonas tetramitiformis]|uniref:Starter acyltransferase (SAT) domain-containing protein n=1 Tax=Cymbomonas tetramitiformis TaxID=36881 RepID=A0AAE0EQ55_9CHLO|nr:hypothetical protein CYMTET_54996 [Cymbomonas tetramitiformis]
MSNRSSSRNDVIAQFAGQGSSGEQYVAELQDCLNGNGATQKSKRLLSSLATSLLEEVDCLPTSVLVRCYPQGVDFGRFSSANSEYAIRKVAAGTVPERARRPKESSAKKECVAADEESSEKSSAIHKHETASVRAAFQDDEASTSTHATNTSAELDTVMSSTAAAAATMANTTTSTRSTIDVSEAYLASTPISCPLLFAAQMANFISCQPADQISTSTYVGSLYHGVDCAIGHSQGVAAAMVTGLAEGDTTFQILCR